MNGILTPVINPFHGLTQEKMMESAVPDDFCYQIKQFLNVLIKESKSHFPVFSELMKEVFKLEDKEESIYNLVGMKFKQDMPEFTNEELRATGILIKSPEVLRILIKWIEELDDMVERPDIIVKRAKVDLARMGETLFKWSSDYYSELTECITKEARSYRERAETADRGIFYSACRNLANHIDQHKSQFEAFSQTEREGGFAVSMLSELTSHNAIAYLNGLIGFLYRMHKKAYRAKQERGWCMLRPDEEILRFSVMDLLRAKCSGTIKEVKIVLSRLQNNPRIKLTRCKNRLATSNRDFLINFRF